MTVFLAVARDKYDRGIYAPGEGGRTYDWRAPLRSAENTHGIRAAYAVLPLEKALGHRYGTHAHFVTYLVRDPAGHLLPRQPLVNKSGLPWLESLGYRVSLGTLAVDHDNPGHALWTPETRAAMEARILASPTLQQATIYFSRRGFRALYALTREVPVEEAEGTLAALYAQLQAEGFQPDPAGLRWTQRYATPNFTRAERNEQGAKIFRAFSPGIWRYGTPFDPPAPLFRGDACARPARPQDPKARATRAALTIPERPELPAWMEPIATRIGHAIRDHVTEGFHFLYLALAATVYHGGIGAPFLRAFLHAVALAEGSTKPAQHASCATYTLQRIAEGRSVTGAKQLRAQWPIIADVVVDALANGMQRKAHAELAQLAKGVTWVPRERVAGPLQEALRSAPDGVSLIQITAGGGKTRAAEEVALERATQAQRTAIAVDKNALAVQVRAELEQFAPLPTRRLFGPASLKNADGTPVCRYIDAAKALAAGGQSVRATLCSAHGARPACEWKETCLASEGMEGDAAAKITLGTHANLARLDAAAGTRGLLVIDEPPAPLQTVTITPDELAALGPMQEHFRARFVLALQPLLEVVTAWVQGDAPEDLVLEPAALLAANADRIAPAVLAEALSATELSPTGDAVQDALRAARAAIPPRPPEQGPTPTAPPLTTSATVRARVMKRFAQTLGAASSVYAALYDAARAEHRVVLRVERVHGDRVLRITGPTEAYLAALRREGPVVLMDANMEVQQPVVEAILGVPLPASRVLRIAIPDSPDATITRTLLWARDCNRKQFRLGPHLVWTRALVSAFEDALRFALTKKATKIFFCSYREVVQMLRWHLEPSARQEIEEAWTAAGRKLSDLRVLHPRVRELLGHYQGAWRFAHYGGTRGMNDAQDCDLYVTLGDPWPDVRQVFHDTQYLGLEEPEVRLRQLAAAELAQVHQRARDVWRTGTLHHLHIGTVPPADPAWATASMAHRTPGVKKRLFVADPALLLALRQQQQLTRVEAARRLGIPERMLARYEHGEIAIAPALLTRLQWTYSGATVPEEPATTEASALPP